jgi:hypothetical protein
MKSFDGSVCRLLSLQLLFGCWEKETNILAKNNSLGWLIETNNPPHVKVTIIYVIAIKSFRLLNLLNQTA